MGLGFAHFWLLIWVGGSAGGGGFSPGNHEDPVSHASLSSPAINYNLEDKGGLRVNAQRGRKMVSTFIYLTGKRHYPQNKFSKKQTVN